MLPYLEDGLLSWDVCQPDLYMKIFSRAQPQLLVLGLFETSSAWAGRTLHLVITQAPSNSRSVRITCTTSIHAPWRDR
jgi:hypothetical protein